MRNSFLGSVAREDELIQALAAALPAETTASTDKPVENALASVVETLVACASKLEGTGHPSLDKVDEVLRFVEAEFFTTASAKKAE